MCWTFSLKYPQAKWLEKLTERGVRERARQLYEQLDQLEGWVAAGRRQMLAESRRQPAKKNLQLIPTLGEISVAQLIATVDTPHRFRSKRQLWSYSGFALETHASGEYRVVGGELQRKRKAPQVRGLNVNHNRGLKEVFKGAATQASSSPRGGVLYEFYRGLLAKGLQPEMARLTLARKIATLVLTLWKKGEEFNAELVKNQASLSA